MVLDVLGHISWMHSGARTSMICLISHELYASITLRAVAERVAMLAVVSFRLLVTNKDTVEKTVEKKGCKKISDKVSLVLLYLFSPAHHKPIHQRCAVNHHSYLPRVRHHDSLIGVVRCFEQPHRGNTASGVEPATRASANITPA